MIIQVQLAMIVVGTLFTLLKNNTTPSNGSSLTNDSSATSKPTCLPFAKNSSPHQIAETNYLNFFSITSGDTTRCVDVITGMEAVTAQYDYINAGLLIKNRKLILSPTNNVGIGHLFDATYDPATKVYALGSSAMKGEAHLENKLREIFFYGTCHAYQLTENKDSTSCQPFVNEDQKETLQKALDQGFKKLKKYREQLQYLDNKHDRNNAILRKNVKDMQHHYTYPKNKNNLGHEIYKGVDPLLAALAEAESMFIPEWIDGLKNANGAANVLKIRIALLHAEIPKPIIEKFFPKIKAHVDEMVHVVKTNHKHDPFASQDNNIYRIDDFIDKIDERMNMKLN